MSPPSPFRRGFTLLEILMVLVISSLLLLGFTAAVMVSERTQDNVSVVSDLENDANEAVQKIVDELRSAGTASSDFSVQNNQVTYRPCIAAYNGSQTWDSPRLLELRDYSPGESDITNGMDDNGNGLVDESRVVLTFTSDGVDHEQTLVRDVAPGGLVFAQNGNDISVTLTLRRLNVDGAPMTVTASTLVSLRN